MISSAIWELSQVRFSKPVQIAQAPGRGQFVVKKFINFKNLRVVIYSKLHAKYHVIIG